MEPFTPFIPLIIIVVVIVVIAQWIKCVWYMKQGGTDHLKAHGIEPVKPSGKSTPIKKPKPQKPRPTDEVVIMSGVQLDGLDKELAEHLKGRTDNVLNLDEDAVLEDSGQIAVWVDFSDFSGRNYEKLGRLPNEVAKDIRKANIARQLEVEICEIWIGDRGGASVQVQLSGKKEQMIRLLEYEVSSRPERKTKKAGYLRGYPTHIYSPDCQLLQLREEWEAYENLLKELIEAGSQSADGSTSHAFELARLYRKQERYDDEEILLKKLFHAECQKPEYISSSAALELARLYRKLKRYEDEKQLITQFQSQLQSKGQDLDDTLASRLRRSTQLAAKVSSK